MSSVPRVITILTALAVGVGLAFFHEEVAARWSLPYTAAFVLGVVLVSLTDRQRFGWIE